MKWLVSAAANAFGWLAKNPEFSANLLVGIGSGVADYNARKEEMRALREAEERRRPKYVGIENYTGQLTADGGLLTNGLLSKYQRR